MHKALRSLTSLQLQRASPYVKYGFAAVMALLGLSLQYALVQLLGHLPFAVFYPILFMVIAIAGYGPGLLINGLFCLAEIIFFIEPRLHLTDYTEIAYAKLILFFSSSLLISKLMDRNQKAQQRLSEELAAQREAELERSRLHRLMADAPVIIWIARGPNHVIELVNRMGRQALPNREITGRPIGDALPEIKAQGFIEHMDRVYQSGRPLIANEVRCEIASRRGGLTTYYFNIACQPWHSPTGHVAGVICYLVNVTDQVLARRKIEVAEERLKLAMQASRQGSWDIDLNTKDVSATPEVYKFFGYPPNPTPKLKHMDLIARLSPDDRVRSAEILNQAIRDGTDYRNEYRVQWADGSSHWITSRGRILRDHLNRPTRMVGISFETTETKNFELELRRAKEDAERANHVKSAFLANMSHEIRTPLAALLGFTDLLREASLSQEERLRYLDIMTRNGIQLSHVINDILDLSKVEAGQLRLEYAEIQPFKVAQEVLSSLSIAAAEKSLKLELSAAEDAPRTMVSDPARLKQILLNIVGNAVKFTNRGFVHVAISGRFSANGEQVVIIEVRDSGIGIPEDQFDNIFHSFTQADNSMTRKFGGTGLGLPLSRRLAQSMGGDLKLKSTKTGVGTVFEISLLVEAPGSPSLKPAAAMPNVADVSAAPPAPAHLGDSSTFRLLVVEDSVDNRELIRLYLAHAGFTAEFAEHGAEAMNRALHKPYDLILMDIQMPVLDGYEATRQLRKLGYQKPIVALTAHALSEFRLKGMKVGFTDYLTKPIHRNELLKTIQRFVRPSPSEKDGGQTSIMS